MRIRNVGLSALAAVAFVSVGLTARAAAAGPVDLGNFEPGSVFYMDKDCGGAPFAHVHVFNQLNVQMDEFDLVGAEVVDPYEHNSATYGDLGIFYITIHCDPSATHHDPATLFDYTYSYTIVSPVADDTTTTADDTTTTGGTIPASGGAHTTSMTMIATFAILAGASLLVVRRRSLG